MQPVSLISSKTSPEVGRRDSDYYCHALCLCVRREWDCVCSKFHDCSVKCVWIPSGQLQPSLQWLSHVWLAWRLEQLLGQALLHSEKSMLYGHFLSVGTNNLMSLYQWQSNNSAKPVIQGHNIKMNPHSKRFHSSTVGPCYLRGHTVWRTLRWFGRGRSHCCF